jgi:NitT/TauT family transport system substrate-binding protein
MAIDDIKLSNIGDSDIGAGFIVNPAQEAVVTWNPIVLSIEDQLANKVTRAFDSSSIPHEILDIMFVRTQILNYHPELAQALVGAWYETMAEMKGANADKALTQMAIEAGTTIGSFKRQLGTTYMYWNPADAATFAKSDKLKEVMDKVRTFSFDHKLWTNANSVDYIGISFPDGTVLGDKNNVKLRFTDKFMSELP